MILCSSLSESALTETSLMEYALDMTFVEDPCQRMFWKDPLRGLNHVRRSLFNGYLVNLVSVIEKMAQSK